MPDFEVTLYLTNGGRATAIENAPSAANMEARIIAQLQQEDDNLRIATGHSILSVNKDHVIGYSIDLTPEHGHHRLP